MHVSACKIRGNSFVSGIYVGLYVATPGIDYYNIPPVGGYITHIDANENRVSDCCLTPTQQFFSYIMARTS